jgi:hypothetical protein
MSDMIRDDIPEFFCKNWEPATNNGWIWIIKQASVGRTIGTDPHVLASVSAAGYLSRARELLFAPRSSVWPKRAIPWTFATTSPKCRRMQLMRL